MSYQSHKMLNLNAFYVGIRLRPGLFTGLTKSSTFLSVFSHVESFSISHYSFIAHLSSAPCNSPQTSQITSPDKKHFVSNSPNLFLLVLGLDSFFSCPQIQDFSLIPILPPSTTCLVSVHKCSS